MKKVLLATTALVVAGVFAAPAQAGLEVSVGGYTAFQAAAFDNDTANNSDRDFQSEAQIFVDAAAKADNGLEYGAHIALDTSTSDSSNADETSLYLSGAWGRVEMGDDDGASDMAVFAPTVGLGQINGSYDDYVPTTARAHGLNDRGVHNFTAIDSDDNTKVTYYTPKYNGFQAGVSYVPEAGTGEGVSFTHTSPKDTIETGLSYTGEVSGVQVKAAGTYVMGEAATGTEDLRAYTVGAKLGYQGFTVGGSYTDNGDSLATAGAANDDITSWTAGVTYENGPWGVGVSYLNTDFDAAGSATTLGVAGATGVGGDYQAWALGGTYTVAAGLTVGADLAFFDRNANGTVNDNDGYVLVTDVTAAF